MNNYFNKNDLQPADIALRCLGSSSPKFVNSIYPMERLTAFHVSNHIPGLTGRWMDTGAIVGGATKGSFHRLVHGHHLFEDGFKVLINSKLKYGEFLHHLGLDILTTRGIPNPLLPTALGQGLTNLGLNHRFVYELMTINVPKILSGGLGIVCSGADVYMAFSDAIPHTFLNAGVHFGLGVLDLAFGLYPPNFFLLLAGASEIGVSFTTAYRAIIDPIVPALGVPTSIFFPALGQSIAMASVIGACVSYFSGKDWIETSKTMVSSGSASAISTTVSFMAAGNGFLSPFLGPICGIASFIVIKNVLDFLWSKNDNKEFQYKELNKDELSVFRRENVIPFFGTPKEPIGMLKGDRLLLNDDGIRKQAEIWAFD